MVFQRCVGMRYGDVFIFWISRNAGSPVQEFKVHHVINDYRKFPFVSIVVPRSDAAYPGIEARCQRFGSCEQDILVAGVSGEAQSVTKATIEHKSQVMRSFII